MKQFKFNCGDKISLLQTAFSSRLAHHIQNTQGFHLIQGLTALLPSQINPPEEQGPRAWALLFEKWREARKLSADPAEVARAWPAWAPQQAKNTYDLQTPGIIDVTVRGAHLVVVNEAWGTEYDPLEILQARHPQPCPPTTLMMSEDEISKFLPRAINALFQCPLTYEDDGSSRLELESTTIVKSTGKNGPFLGLLTSRIWILCSGVVTVRAVTVVRLPESPYFPNFGVEARASEPPSAGVAPNMSEPLNQSVEPLNLNEGQAGSQGEAGRDWVELHMDDFDFSLLL